MLSHIKRIDFVRCMANSDGEPIEGTDEELTVIFNTNVISVEEVNELLDTGMYEFDVRVVPMSRKRADYLKGETGE